MPITQQGRQLPLASPTHSHLARGLCVWNWCYSLARACSLRCSWQNPSYCCPPLPGDSSKKSSSLMASVEISALLVVADIKAQPSPSYLDSSAHFPTTSYPASGSIEVHTWQSPPHLCTWLPWKACQCSFPILHLAGWEETEVDGRVGIKEGTIFWESWHTGECVLNISNLCLKLFSSAWSKTQ